MQAIEHEMILSIRFYHGVVGAIWLEGPHLVFARGEARGRENNHGEKAISECTLWEEVKRWRRGLLGSLGRWGFLNKEESGNRQDSPFPPLYFVV